ncbi:UDP-glucose 4-epimerase [Desulfacinum hydrothermale DSM 13146]|uniref:UDP-glucose 4-epimerase n=1 Tax=Desulfacinum hydrothermale DSM 13146 TaxID=1121390 RepID=A0A1W1XUD2_9BACT|nr:NAD-dependent epimerase/dehydratase family protein [Desulfacinum hydrothermale]SMC27151.1 UDP-glucose 4-epimerase [Desulfacinum hydrothermale DSM 13146]
MSKKTSAEAVCVVTGAAGFVGSHLCERLLGLGCRVMGVDNFFSGRWENLTPFRDHPRFSFLERSVTEPGLLREIAAEHGPLACVFHLAAIVSVPYSVDHPEETWAVNYQSTIGLLQEAGRLGCARFVFAGSAAEYGDDARLPLRESYAGDQTSWLSPYGEAKYRSSRAVAACGDGPRGVALRCFNIFGPRQDPSSPYSGVISRFAEMAVRGEALTIFGDGHQSRDFVYVSDVVDAYCRAAGLVASAPEVPAGIYNVGSGTRTTILELARMILSLTERGESIRFYAERPGDIRHSVACIDAIQAVMAWRPRVSLEEGLRETLRWMQSQGA